MVADGTTQTLYNGPQRSAGLRWSTLPTTPGEYEVTVRVFGSMTTGFVYTFQLIVVPPAQRAFTDGQFLDAPISQTASVRRASTILLWQGGSASMDKPMLMVEGIDAAQQNGPAAYYALGLELFQAGQANGADVAILDFADGGRDMALNANVVMDAINLVRRYKTDASRGIDLIGVSMGESWHATPSPNLSRIRFRTTWPASYRWTRRSKEPSLTRRCRTNLPITTGIMARRCP